MNYQPTAHDIQIKITVKGHPKSADNNIASYIDPKLLIQVFDLL